MQFALWQLKEDYKTQAYHCYVADMLRCCAVSLGAQVDKRYSDIVAEVENPSRAAHETTLEEAEAVWQQALADSRRDAQERMGGETV